MPLSTILRLTMLIIPIPPLIMSIFIPTLPIAPSMRVTILLIPLLRRYHAPRALTAIMLRISLMLILIYFIIPQRLCRNSMIPYIVFMAWKGWLGIVY
jgi:hypothetical protein